MKKSQLTETVLRALRNPTTEAEEEEENVDIKKDIDITDIEDVDIDDESVESDIEVKTMVPGEGADVAAVQGLLMKAQQAATKLGDDKLLAQIGNTIIYFTRAHGVKVGGEEDLGENKRARYKSLAEKVIARIKEQNGQVKKKR